MTIAKNRIRAICRKIYSTSFIRTDFIVVQQVFVARTGNSSCLISNTRCICHFGRTCCSRAVCKIGISVITQRKPKIILVTGNNSGIAAGCLISQ